MSCINLRVDLMFEQGLVDEVRGLMDQGLGDALTSMQAIGYKEIIDALRGAITMDEAPVSLSRCARVAMPSASYPGLSVTIASCGSIWMSLRSMRSLLIFTVASRLPNGSFSFGSYGA